MELKDTLLKTFAKAMQTPNAKETKLYYATVVDVQGSGDNKKVFVHLDGSEEGTRTPVIEGTQVLVDDRVMVTIENHKAIIMNNITSPATGRTESSYMDLLPEGLLIGEITNSNHPYRVLIRPGGIDLKNGSDVLSTYSGSALTFYIPGSNPLTAAATINSTGLNISKGSINLGNNFIVTSAGAVTIKSGSITLGSYFSVTSAGVLTAKSGIIGGWDISANTLSSTTYGVGSIRSAYSETAIFIENGEIKFKNSYSASSNTYVLNSEGVWGYFYVNDRLYCNNTFVTDGQLHLGTAYNDDIHVSCVWSDNGWHDIITRNGSTNDVYIGGSKDITNVTTRTFIRGDTVKLQHASGDTITSDRNIKKDITTYDSRYDDFYDALKPVTYKFINGKSGRVHSGFISQEVRDALIASGLSTNDFGGYIKDELTQREVDTDGSDFETSDINYLLDHDITEIHQLIYQEFIALNTWQIQKLKKRLAELEERLNE